MFFFLGKVLHFDNKKTQFKLHNNFFLEKMLQKLPYFEEKGHMLPYLDNEFLLVAIMT